MMELQRDPRVRLLRLRRAGERDGAMHRQRAGQAIGRRVAAVNVPCPTCGQINQLCFEPNGTVRSRPALLPAAVPTFSLN